LILLSICNKGKNLEVQITSNYYRCRMQRSGFSVQLLTVPDSVPLDLASSKHSSKGPGKPLSPSIHTLRELAALHKSENQI